MSKTKMGLKKFGRMNLIFEFPMKIKLYDNFPENLKRKNLTHFFLDIFD